MNFASYSDYYEDIGNSKRTLIHCIYHIVNYKTTVEQINPTGNLITLSNTLANEQEIADWRKY